jgi:O-methyltransferase domain/Dimerisation domain
MNDHPGNQNPDVPTAERAQALFRMITGYRITQMIYVVAKLGIADLLKDGPKSAEALAQTTHTHARSLYRILRALASVGIFAEDTQGRFALTPLAELLQTGVPSSQRPAALFFAESSQWQSWGELLYTVTTGEPSFQRLYGMDAWEYRARDPELNAIFDDFMTVNTTNQAVDVVPAYDFSDIGTLVDVGGGHGALISAILRANPQMHGILCDEPQVVSGAHSLLEAGGVIDRCEIVPCDFFSSVPGGGDAYVLKLIIHDWDDERAVAILKNCRGAMPEHGRLLLVENVIPPGNDPHRGKMTDIEMMVTLGGRERSEPEYRALFTEAGFTLTKIVPTQSALSIIEATPE